MYALSRKNAQGEVKTTIYFVLLNKVSASLKLRLGCED
jgi:hypothetical protein